MRIVKSVTREELIEEVQSLSLEGRIRFEECFRDMQLGKSIFEYLKGEELPWYFALNPGKLLNWNLWFAKQFIFALIDRARLGIGGMMK